MRRPRNPSGRMSNPMRDALNIRNRGGDAPRARQRERGGRDELSSIIDEQVGEQIEKLENKLVDSFREMGQRVVDQSTEALNNQLDDRISQLEEISAIQTETINQLRDTSRNAEQRVSGVVNNIERALGNAVPGFKLEPPAHLQHQITDAEERRLVKAPTRAVMEDGKIPDLYCPKCTSTSVRRATRSGIWEEFLRLFFIAPFRCRACRHKFYRF
ncbi:MAG TPA: hypothetical protein VHA14_10920 [Bryobacteraceae bacterium]|nr:hypothetical protein [Bryobacteraceae bacterium]